MLRRTLLRFFAALPVLHSARGYGAVSSDTGVQRGSAQSAVFSAYIDTLIPADASPSGTDLGTDRSLWTEAARSQTTRELYAAGTRWLQQAAQVQFKQDFADLDGPQRVAIVQRAEQSPVTSQPYRFFEHSRDRAMAFYYSQPEAWTTLAEAHAPQPVGHMGYQNAPNIPR